MTSAPVPLAEQPTASIAELYVKQRLDALFGSRKAGRRVGSAVDLEIALQQAVLATLQQHERAMAALREPTAELVEAAAGAAWEEDGESAWPPSDPETRALYFREARAALKAAGKMLAALDAANTGDAVTTEEDKQKHGEEDRC